ncbi:MAG: hypothetical protein Harvfovirus64_4 [Harvfovirus sp.]|uniref:Sel1 repeat family protein n=1 Tax=Harvfovirus sp. TaxID=2487768 RepID=A0A3G5A3Q1_9VIRU|nr:MAG: hypothetical protein Harvfovirus64_4 [Harvfovirus sp.]
MIKCKRVLSTAADDEKRKKLLEATLEGNNEPMMKIIDLIEHYSKIPCFRSDVEEMKNFYSSHAEKNGNALFLLGLIHYQKSNAECVKFFSAAAEMNNAYGLAYLGFLNESGKYIAASLTEATRLYTASVDKSNYLGQYFFGMMLQSTADGEKLLKLSAEQNYIKAINQLKKIDN